MTLVLLVAGVGMGGGVAAAPSASYSTPVRHRVGVVHPLVATVGGPGVSMWGVSRGR